MGTAIKLKPKAINNYRKYENALKEIDRLWDAKVNTTKSVRIRVLVKFIQAYLAKRFAIPPADSVDALKCRMEQMGFSQMTIAACLADLA